MKNNNLKFLEIFIDQTEMGSKKQTMTVYVYQILDIYLFIYYVMSLNITNEICQWNYNGIFNSECKSLENFLCGVPGINA